MNKYDEFAFQGSPNGDVEGFMGKQSFWFPYDGFKDEARARSELERLAVGALTLLLGSAERAEEVVAAAKEATVKEYRATLVCTGCEGHPSPEWECEWCPHNGFYHEGESVGYTITRLSAFSDEEAVKKARELVWEGVYLERLDDVSGHRVSLSMGE